jgi:hypothetical protein
MPPKGLRPSTPGQIVQIDTVFVNLAPGKAVKHFTAYNPVAKWMVAGIPGRATANLAARFLDKVLSQMPFKVTGIQVDGGSEFMADFEQGMQANKLDLFVLPPKRPQLNGAVERCNRAWRYEFYAVHDLPHQIDKIAKHVDAFQHLYNHLARMALSTQRRLASTSISAESGVIRISYVLSADRPSTTFGRPLIIRHDPRLLLSRHSRRRPARVKPRSRRTGSRSLDLSLSSEIVISRSPHQAPNIIPRADRRKVARPIDTR